MKKSIIVFCAAALLAGCGTNTGNGGPTVFQGRFIGYNNEFVEFFLPTDSGDFQEIQVNVQPDGTFCDTIQFDKNLYDAALFADKFMFRISVEQGKTYNAEFDITEEGVETNFRFIGEGAAENDYMRHLWSINLAELIAPATSFKENREILDKAVSPLREELKTIDNKAFVKYYQNDLKEKETTYAYYFPFYAANNTGAYNQDADFDAFVAGQKKLSDQEFRTLTENVFTVASYSCNKISVTDALKAAESCSVKKEQKDLAMSIILNSLIGAGNTNGLAEGSEYFMDTVTNEDYLERAEEICNNALLLAPGIDAPKIEFEDLSGKIHNLSEFRGKALYIDLWASWCGPCCEEIPYLAKFVESLGKDAPVTCISISIDDNRQDWESKLKEVGSSWPQYLATEAGQASISGKYFVSGIPRFLLIDADGKIASVNAPRPSSSDLLEELLSLL